MSLVYLWFIAFLSKILSLFYPAWQVVVCLFLMLCIVLAVMSFAMSCKARFLFTPKDLLHVLVASWCRNEM